jgi:hypothetical protein
VSSFSSLFGRLPGQRAAAQRRRQTRRHALAGFEAALAELGRELKRLAQLSHTTDHDDAAAIVREATITSRILGVLQRGERLTSDLSDDGVASAWRRLAASTGRARLLGQGPHRAAKLEDAAAECQRLQQIVEQELAGWEGVPDEHTPGE